MTLQLRMPTRLRVSERQAGTWGVFVWGKGSWAGRDHEVVTEVEPVMVIKSGEPVGKALSVQSSPVVLSRFVLQAIRPVLPWGSFTWGIGTWGAVAAVLPEFEPSTKVVSGEPARQALSKRPVSRTVSGEPPVKASTTVEGG